MSRSPFIATLALIMLATPAAAGSEAKFMKQLESLQMNNELLEIDGDQPGSLARKRDLRSMQNLMQKRQEALAGKKLLDEVLSLKDDLLDELD